MLLISGALLPFIVSLLSSNYSSRAGLLENVQRMRITIYQGHPVIDTACLLSMSKEGAKEEYSALEKLVCSDRQGAVILPFVYVVLASSVAVFAGLLMLFVF